MKMIKLFRLVSLLLVVSIGALFMTYAYTQQSVYTNRVIEVNKGYGYEIYAKGKLIISQDQVPGIAGVAVFAKKEHAQLTADLVINKMKNGTNPAIHVSEMVNRGITNAHIIYE